MGPYFSRMFHEKDKEELNALYNLVAGRNRTVHEFEWEWLKPPDGWGSMWLIIDAENEKIIGHHGLIPLPFTCFGRRILVGKTENTVMHPDYRGKRIYFPFEQQFLAEAVKRFQLNYTISGVAEQGRIRLKLGYRVLGGYSHFFRASNSRALSCFLCRRIGKNRSGTSVSVVKWLVRALAPLLMPVFLRRGKTRDGLTLEKVENIELIAEEWEAFWNKNRASFGITIDRTVPYLKWRLFENPCVDFEFYLARLDGKIVGAVALKYRAKAAIIEDLIAAGDDDILFNTILGGVIQKMNRRSFFLVFFNTLECSGRMCRRLSANGFIDGSRIFKFSKKLVRKRSLFMVKLLDNSLNSNKILAPEAWYYTGFFGEGVR